MSYYPASVMNVIRNLSRLPGVGEKTAERLAMHILRMPRADAEKLTRSIAELKEKVRICSRCFGLSDGELCGICMNPSRRADLLCVVEQPAEMVAVEKSGAFQGCYHVLQGALSPMDGVGPNDIRIKELMERVQRDGVTEVILATGTTVEGEATAAFIQEKLAPLGVKATRIASGVPIGGEIKYVDQVTLRRAMESRYAL